MKEMSVLLEKNIPSRFLNQVNEKSPQENYKSEKARIRKFFEEKQTNEEFKEALNE